MVSKKYGYFDYHFLDEFKLRGESKKVVIVDWGKVKKFEKYSLVNNPETRMECAIAVLQGRIDLLDKNLRESLQEDENLINNDIFTAFSIVCDALHNCKVPSSRLI